MNSRKIVSYLCVVGMMVMAVTSCKEDAVKATLKATTALTANTLSAPADNAVYVLTLPNAANVFETFKWTASDFGFPASVTYKVQMDKSTGDFTTPVEIVSVVGKLEASILIGAMNDKLLGLGLTPQAAANIKIRVVSSVNDKVDKITSNVRTVNVTPYATSFPSIYGMGDGLKGWGPWGGATDASVEFPSSNYQIYETQALLTQNTGAFRFFKQFDWNPTSYNYPYFTTVDAKLSNANDGDSNFKFTGTTGWYTIHVDLNTKSVTLTATTEPTMYIVGDGSPAGWNWGTALKMTFKKPGVFQATAAFNGAGAFRFFPNFNDWATSYNYPYFTSVNAQFKNANDGDSNLKLVAANATLTIVVDVPNKKVTVP